MTGTFEVLVRFAPEDNAAEMGALLAEGKNCLLVGPHKNRRVARSWILEGVAGPDRDLIEGDDGGGLAGVDASERGPNAHKTTTPGKGGRSQHEVSSELAPGRFFLT
jgi:hypothetical protein